MGIFDMFENSKQTPPVSEPKKTNVITPQEIVIMALEHEPKNIYVDASGYLEPSVREAVNRIMVYDGLTPVSVAVMLMNDSQTMKQNMRNADVDTLLIFLKFLAFKAGETQDNQLIGLVQNFLISVLQEKLSKS